MAATEQPAQRELSSDKAQRIVDAMRSSVGRRGVAGSTFDHVAREAGVSRGLLHYYFGTKERLLVEVVRRDCDMRLARIDLALSAAQTAEDFIDVLVGQLEQLVAHEPEFVPLLCELISLSRRNDEIATELRGLYERSQSRVAEMLVAKERAGVLALHAEPEAIAAVLFSLGDGLSQRMLVTGGDFDSVIAAGVTCARALLA